MSDLVLTPESLQAWLALYAAALAIGQAAVDGVKKLAKKELSPAELQQLERAWDDDVQRSARNAGIPAQPDVPLDPTA